MSGKTSLKLYAFVSTANKLTTNKHIPWKFTSFYRYNIYISIYIWSNLLDCWPLDLIRITTAASTTTTITTTATIRIRSVKILVTFESSFSRDMWRFDTFKQGRKTLKIV